MRTFLALFVLAASSLHAQAIRYDWISSTTNSSCVSGALCPILAIPGTTVNVCTGTPANLTACLSSLATTYTNAGAGTACATTSQLTPATGGACLSTSDNQGNYGWWILPGSYSYFLTIPRTAGGGSYGPYPFSLGASQGCPSGFTCDVNYATLALACSAAGSGSLFVSHAWNGLTTQTYACNMTFGGNGRIQPASGQTVTLSGAITAGDFQILDYSAGGNFLVTGGADSSVQWSGAKGDNSTNNSTAIQNSIITAMNSGRSLHWPAGTYLTCNSTATNTGALSMYGDGLYESTAARHPSCLQASTDLLDVVNAASITIRGMGFDMKGNGTNFNNSAVQTTNAGSVTVDGAYFANGQAVGLSCQVCQNLTVTNSTFYKNFWFGVSAASGGTTASPVYGKNFTITGNTFIDQPIGVGFSFFLSNIAVTGNTFDRSGVALVQTPHAYAVIDGNTFNGVPDQGCLVAGTCGTTAGNYSAMFLEGASDWDVGKNEISNTTSVQSGLTCIGTTLQIPASTGTITELPCSRWHIDGLTVSNSGGNSILVSAKSNGGSPTFGVEGSVKNTHVINGSNQCQVIGGMVGLDESNNDCDTAANGGYTLSNNQNFSFRSNYCRNCNTSAGGGNFPGLSLTGTSTLNGDIFDNIFQNDNGNALSYGIQDATTIANQGAQIRHGRNSCSSGCGSLYIPTPLIPAAGTWAVGNFIENISVANGPVGWVNTVAGTPGTWIPVGYFRSAMCANATSANVPCAAASYGYFVVPASAASTNVFTTAIPASSSGIGPVVHIEQVQGTTAGTILGVTCASTVTSPLTSAINVAGGSFTVSLSVAPVTNPGCYTYYVFNPDGR